MRLVLVRHGHAGRKDRWRGADKLRPLSSRGGHQAEALVDMVAPLQPTRIVSSPYLRCIETMEPLSIKLGYKIERSAALVPDAPTKGTRLVRRLGSSTAANGTVLCTHGEVMAVVLARVAKEDGLKLERRLPGLKGCAWVLDFEGGRLVAARYLAPT